MISRRTILLYNFGLAAALAAAGLLMIYALSFLGPDASAITKLADTRARAAKEIQEEQDPERLRSEAAYYLRLTEDLKKAKDEDTIEIFTNIRYACFVLAWMYFVGGLLGFGVERARHQAPDAA